jgi:DNA-binding transcriptional LysR family regulator
MELRHLRYFIAVAEELNFSRAAVRLHIAQPPLSQQIRDLERDLDVQLFERGARRVRLTAAGEALLTEARATLAQSEHARLTAQRAQRGEYGTLEIGFLTSTTNARLAGIVRTFRREYPGVTLGLHDLSEVEILQRLRERRLHAGLLRGFAGDSELAVEPVWREPMNVALPAEHPLARRSAVRLAQLADEPLIMLEDARFPLGNSCLRLLCEQAGFRPRVVQFTRDMQSLIWLVAAGVGCGFVADGLRDFRRDGMVYRPLTPRINAEMRMLWRTDDRAPALTAFRALMHKQTRGGKRRSGTPSRAAV